MGLDAINVDDESLSDALLEMSKERAEEISVLRH